MGKEDFKGFIEFLTWHLQVTDGIYPMSIQIQNPKVKEALAQLSPSDSRKVKRKFRKVWRKANEDLNRGIPTREDMLERKIVALRHYIKKALKAAVKA